MRVSGSGGTGRLQTELDGWVYWLRVAEDNGNPAWDREIRRRREGIPQIIVSIEKKCETELTNKYTN